LSRLNRAETIVRAPGMDAVLVANPADKAVYFYKEGMASPMGSFTNYDRKPRAVNVVDRSLRERSEPGGYQTVARLREPGSYDVVFFLDPPRVVHCFPLTVGESPERSRMRAARVVGVALGERPGVLRRGRPTRLEFPLTRPAGPVPAAELADVA